MTRPRGDGPTATVTSAACLACWAQALQLTLYAEVQAAPRVVVGEWLVRELQIGMLLGVSQVDDLQQDAEVLVKIVCHLSVQLSVRGLVHRVDLRRAVNVGKRKR